MISVIICSYNPDNLKRIKENIEASIGVEYELIAVDNRESKNGICSVYNEAARRANFSILCFMHEDVKLHTKKWGNELVQLFNNENIGIVGVSGSVYKSAYPASWSACDPSCYRGNTIQHFKNRPEPVVCIVNPLSKKYDEVAVADGVFIATKKKILQSHLFDEENFTGFHGYDLDFSLNVGRNYNIVVTYDILLEHFSEGSFNINWFYDTLRLHKKWKRSLPKQIIYLNKQEKKNSDFISLKSFLQSALQFSSSKKLIIYYYLQLIFFYWRYNHLNFLKTVSKKIIGIRND